MCCFIKPLVVTGYKIVAEKDGRYYSPATGIEYKEGPVEIPKEQNKIVRIFNDLIQPGEYSYESNMIGKTAMFKELSPAEERKCRWVYDITPGYVLSVVEMSLTGDLFTGEYSGELVYLGTVIKAIRKL